MGPVRPYSMRVPRLLWGGSLGTLDTFLAPDLSKGVGELVRRQRRTKGLSMARVPPHGAAPVVG